MADLHLTAAEIAAHRQRLRRRWHETTPLWLDPLQVHFEREYWSPLQHQTQTTQQRMEQLAQLLAKARKSVR